MICRSVEKLNYILPMVIVLIAATIMGCRYQGTHLQYEKPYNPIPQDRSVIQSRLANGFQVMLRPLIDCKTIYFALAVKTGAAAEREFEHGVAHFVEHMAFNGTERFPGNQIITLLQKSGVESGADLNAFTNYNYTCFYIQIPTDNPSLLSRSLEILEQWASAVSFEPSEVKKEKGVILEEIRRENSGRRDLNNLYRIGTRFENHPIAGTAEDIAGISRRKLVEFYKRWYQPERMVLAVVGGIDEVQLIKQIKGTFEHLRNTNTAYFKPWEQTPVVNKKVLQNIDSGDGKNHITLTWAHHRNPISDLGDLQEKMLQDFVATLTQRHLSQTMDIDKDSITALAVHSKQLNLKTSLNQIQITVDDNAPLETAGAVWPEIVQLRSKGFSEQEIELARQAKRFELDSQSNFVHLKSEAIRLINSAIFTLPLVNPDIYAIMYQRFLPEINASSVKKRFNEMFASGPNFIVLGMPVDYKDVRLAADVATAVLKQGLPPERTSETRDSEPEMPAPRTNPGRITGQDHLDLLGIIQAERWRLSNGMMFYLKEIADKNLISFYLVAPGGRNALSADELPAAGLLPMFIRFATVGHHPLKTYENNLSNRGIDLHIFVKENLHGFRGSFPKKECGYVLGLIHQLMANATVDTALFQKVQRQFVNSRKHLEAAPWKRLDIQIQRRRYGDNNRRWPPPADLFSRVTPEDVLSVFRQLFVNANGFHFIYMGDKQHIDLKQMVAANLASLPHQPQAHQHVKHPVEICDQNKILHSDENPENRSDVTLVYLVKGHDQSSVEQMERDILLHVIESRLDEIIREEYSMVYSIDIDNTSSRYPADVWSITIRFTCAPTNKDRIVQLIHKELAALGVDGPQEDELRGAILHLRHDSGYLEKNISFIVSLIEDQYIHKIADIEGLRYQNLLDGITKSEITRMAHICFNSRNRIIQAELDPPGKNH